jgi:homoserine O-acetyltransferase
MSGTEEELRAGAGVSEVKVAEIDLMGGAFRLECGAALSQLQIAYETYGNLSPARDNVIFICHALSGDSHVASHPSPGSAPGWWERMVGPGKGIDTDYYYVICANILGGCKGTTGPSSLNPETGRPYGSSFPTITIGDMVEAHRLLLQHLGIARIAGVTGGSLGGMQALEWSIRFPDMVDRCICIAAGASLSAQALAFGVIGRSAIMSDPLWHGGDYYGLEEEPSDGLALARKIGHITYLSSEMMSKKFGRERRSPDESEHAQGDLPGISNPDSKFRTSFQVESYLNYQGRKFVEQFDANSYLHITRAVDEYDLVERFGSLEQAFAPIQAKVLVLALSSDWLFTPEQSVELANGLMEAGKRVSYCRLEVPHGHDAFLLDIKHLAEVMQAFLPWVEHKGLPADEMEDEAAASAEYAMIRDTVGHGKRVLDLGCGDGRLLSMLARERGALGLGVDIKIENIIEVINRGHDVLQTDLDQGLAAIPAGSYDYAILSETLQVVRKPRRVLKEMLRVARQCIVTFPNFARSSNRLQLGLTGRMPKSGTIPFEWYDTPNIHHTTLKDFIDLCRQEQIKILDMVCISKSIVDRLLVRLGLRNLGADKVLVRFASSVPTE